MEIAPEAMQTMTSTKEYPEAHLLGIPPEVRLIIYDFLFPRPGAKPLLNDFIDPIPQAATTLAPLLSCRLINQEAWAQAFSNTVFSLNIFGVMGPRPQIFNPLLNLPPGIKAKLRHLQVRWDRAYTLSNSTGPSNMPAILEAEAARLLKRLEERVKTDLVALDLQLDTSTKPVSRFMLKKGTLEGAPQGRVQRNSIRFLLVTDIVVTPVATRWANSAQCGHG